MKVRNFGQQIRWNSHCQHLTQKLPSKNPFRHRRGGDGFPEALHPDARLQGTRPLRRRRQLLAPPGGRGAVVGLRARSVRLGPWLGLGGLGSLGPGIIGFVTWLWQIIGPQVQQPDVVVETDEQPSLNKGYKFSLFFLMLEVQPPTCCYCHRPYAAPSAGCGPHRHLLWTNHRPSFLYKMVCQEKMPSHFSIFAVPSCHHHGHIAHLWHRPCHCGHLLGA